MKIFKTGYELVKTEKLDKLVMDMETYKNENINLKRSIETLKLEKTSLEMLLDIEQQNTRMGA